MKCPIPDWPEDKTEGPGNEVAEEEEEGAVDEEEEEEEGTGCGGRGGA